MRKAATLLETLTVILIIVILSCILIPVAHGVYRLFLRMTVDEYDYYYKNDPEGKWKKESDGLFLRQGWEK